MFLGRALGAGGFERPVAIKVMHPHIATDPEFVTMFLDEARLAARIRHANVVPTVDVEHDESGVFLVMEYVDGMSLHRLAKTFRAAKVHLPVPIALRIMIDALSGLHAAHELRSQDGAPLMLVHRDVSPQNILIGTDGVARITDFGVARAESRLSAATKTGQVKGKTAYMSSEQLRSKPVDRRSDIYAAGVVLWELLAGQRLFHGDSEGAVVLAAAEGATQTPSQVNPQSPVALDAVVMKALQREPADRFPTAAAFAEALEETAHAMGMRVAKPRAVSLLLRADPEASQDEIPPACRAVVAHLREEVATAAARAHTQLPHHVPGEDVTSKPTDKVEVRELDRAAPTMEQPASSPKTSAATVLSSEIVPKKKSPVGLVMAGLGAVAAVGAIVYFIGGRGDRGPDTQSSGERLAHEAAAAQGAGSTSASRERASAIETATAQSSAPSVPASAGPSTTAPAIASSARPSATAPTRPKPTIERTAPSTATAFRPKVL